jgi:hypothetical protein
MVSDEIMKLLELEISKKEKDIILHQFWTDFDRYEEDDISNLRNLNIQRDWYNRKDYCVEEELFDTFLWTLKFDNRNYSMERDKIFFSLLLRRKKIEYIKNPPSNYSKCFSIIDYNWFNHIMPLYTFCRILWMDDYDDSANLEKILNNAGIQIW